mmetsp:Transcript_9865/g.17456  ORF Transcript_9865/g.17456 Transcript_9865/m.17456 type:complete len:801 (+) Transcript_9865:196-2598(+)
MMMRSATFILFLLLSACGNVASADNLRKRSKEVAKGFANFEPQAINHGRRPDAAAPKDYASMKMSQQPRSRSELEQGHLASAARMNKKKPKKVQVRNLMLERCGKDGTQYVVQCVVGTEQRCHEELTRAGAVIVNPLPNSDFFAVCVDTEEERELLMELTDVEDIEEDHVRTLSYLPELTKRVDRRQMQSQGQQTPYGVSLIKADEFWSIKGEKGSGIKVCIIDTGLFVGHEDMQGVDFSGSIDSSVVSSWDDDENGHGSHVAGTIAAIDNGFGVVGVAPEVSLFIVKVFEGAEAQFTGSTLASAMEECRKSGSDIISMSLGGPQQSSVERNIVTQLVNQGIQIIAASGNSGDGPNPVEYPAGYDDAISVAAIDDRKDIAWFSTHNSHVDVSAPGVDVLSLSQECYDCYSLSSGTSMATPHVSGVFALLMSKYPNKSIFDIRQAIEESAIDAGACGTDRMFGHGIVDVMAAADYLETGSTASELGGCVTTKITVKTDNWGSEMSYVIRNSDNEIVYRNGPYPNQQATYTDEFKLPPGCYEFEMRDSYGDGICCEEGSGYFKVEHNGVEEVFNDAFMTGSSVKASFGCGGGGNQPTPTSSPISPTNPPDEEAICGNGIVEGSEECDDGNNINTDLCTNECRHAKCGDGFLQPGEECDDGNGTNGDGCSSDCKIETISTFCQTGEAHVELYLLADDYSYNENELYFFESDGQSIAEDTEFIWIGTQRGIENNKKYELSECVDSSKCYKFFFFDVFGDGLWGEEGLRLLWNEVETLVIEPYEVGNLWDGGPTVYWMRELGNCS